MNTKRKKIGRKLLSFLLALAMLVGLVPGMGLTAYAAGGGTEVTQANVICQQYSYMDAGSYSGGVIYDTPPADITNIALADAQAFGAAVNCPTTYWVVVYAKDGDNLKWTSNGKTGEQTSTPRSASGRVLSAWCELYNDDVFHFGGIYDPNRDVTFYFSKGLVTVSVTGVSLDKTTAQTIEVDGKVSFTATVSPDDATDKTVKWSVGGTDTGAVKLYTDEACTTEVGANATDKLTVYAKGISAGSATITATSNADSEKKASCDVTVNAAQTQTEELLTTITATGEKQASYSTANVATVSFSNLPNYGSVYNANWGWWGYGWTATVTPVEGYTITKCVFYDDANRTATDSEAPFVVETTEEDKTPKVNGTPILAGTSKGIKKIEVYGYATPTTVDVSGVALNKNVLELNEGKDETLTAIVDPDDATDKTVTWSSDNTAVATVDENGKVTAVSAGTANITATATNGTDDTSDDQTATCAVIVNSASSFSHVSLSLGDDLALNFYSDTITADNYTEYSVKFSGKCVDSESGFEFKNGKYCATTHIFAKNMNEKITVALYKGEEQIGGELEYSVNDYLNAPAHSYADDKTKTLIAATKKYGEAADNYFNGASNTFTFSDIDASAYAPDFGAGDAKLSLVLDSKTAIRLYVKGVTAGTEASGFTSNASSADKANAGYPSYFEITGLTPKQLAAQQSITVDDVEYKFSGLSWAYLILNNSGSSDKNKNMAKAIMEYYTAAKNYAIVDVSEVSINTPPTRLNVGDTGTFSATVSPDNATDKTVTWSASPSGILTIDSATGAYEAVGTGEVTVTATAGGKTASCTMNVVVPVSGIVINNAPTEALFVNSTGTLTATVSPDNATDKTVVWSSSDPDYVSINAETGEYTIMGTKGYGSATITATATNGTEDTSDDVTATCTITGKVTYTSLSAGTVLHVGDTFYAGKVYFNTKPAMSFQDSNGVITLVEYNGCYKFKRGSNGTMPNVTAYKIKDNTDGVYIVSGSGTSTNDKFTLAVHTK